MKLTKAQLASLLNQHKGTGYIIIKTEDNNIRIVSINLGRNGHQWFAGDNGKPLEDYMEDLRGEIG